MSSRRYLRPYSQVQSLFLWCFSSFYSKCLCCSVSTALTNQATLMVICPEGRVTFKCQHLMFWCKLSRKNRAAFTYVIVYSNINRKDMYIYWNNVLFWKSLINPWQGGHTHGFSVIFLFVRSTTEHVKLVIKELFIHLFWQGQYFPEEALILELC